MNEGPTIHHTVSKERGIWESPIVATGDVYRFTFEESGEFPYWCTLHPTSMLGSVVATEE